jgi:hypothetical protein
MWAPVRWSGETRRNTVRAGRRVTTQVPIVIAARAAPRHRAMMPPASGFRCVAVGEVRGTPATGGWMVARRQAWYDQRAFSRRVSATTKRAKHRPADGIGGGARKSRSEERVGQRSDSRPGQRGRPGRARQARTDRCPGRRERGPIDDLVAGFRRRTRAVGGRHGRDARGQVDLGRHPGCRIQDRTSCGAPATRRPERTGGRNHGANDAWQPNDLRSRSASARTS